MADPELTIHNLQIHRESWLKCSFTILTRDSPHVQSDYSIMLCQVTLAIHSR